MVLDHGCHGFAKMGIFGGSSVLDMVMVVLFFRLIERIHLAVSESGENLGKGHGDLGLTKEQTRFSEGPLTMLIPLLAAATVVLAIGVYNQEVVDLIEIFLDPFDLPGEPASK